MTGWVRVNDNLPEAMNGAPGVEPTLSDDVLAFFPGGDSQYDICNYDYETDEWALVNKSFEWADCAPTHWMPLPSPPEVTP